MGTTQRVATWLELAAAPLLRREDCCVKLHAVGHEDSRCFAISMDDRWVCAGNGDLTVFKGLGAALHFLEVLRVDAFEPGERTPQSQLHQRGHCCLMADRQKGLLPCRACLTSRPHKSDPTH
jgi:hypothetical protein